MEGEGKGFCCINPHVFFVFFFALQKPISANFHIRRRQIHYIDT